MDEELPRRRAVDGLIAQHWIGRRVVALLRRVPTTSRVSKVIAILILQTRIDALDDLRRAVLRVIKASAEFVTRLIACPPLTYLPFVWLWSEIDLVCECAIWVDGRECIPAA